MIYSTCWPKYLNYIRLIIFKNWLAKRYLHLGLACSLGRILSVKSKAFAIPWKKVLNQNFYLKLFLWMRNLSTIMERSIWDILMTPRGGLPYKKDRGPKCEPHPVNRIFSVFSTSTLTCPFSYECPPRWCLQALTNEDKLGFW